MLTTALIWIEETETEIVGVTTFLASISKAYQEPAVRLRETVPDPATVVELPEAQVFVAEKSTFCPQCKKLFLAVVEL